MAVDMITILSMHDLPRDLVKTRDLILGQPISSKIDWEGWLFLCDV